MNHSKRPTNGRATQRDLLAAALEYHGRGWSILPMRMATKKPAVKWKRFQLTRAAGPLLQKWFGTRADRGIAVIFGDVSGRLASRDFDTLESYRRWADVHSDLARTLPTVVTRRGRHVYCIAAAGSIEAIRSELGKPNGTGALAFDDGELRAGIGCYSVLPPSVHPSGHVYRWEIAPDDEIPSVDLKAAGFLGTSVEDQDAATERTEQTEAMSEAGTASQLIYTPLPRFTQSAPFSPSALPSLLHERDDKRNCDGVDDIPEAVEAAIRRALPTRSGERNRQVFRLARELKAVVALANAQAGDLMPFVRRWHALASPIITTKPWDDTWFDFLYAWPRVKHPAGQEPVALAFQRAAATEPPEVASQFERPEIRLLVALCRELQRGAGDSPFFLDTRTAGKLLKADHATAWRWLRGLCNCEILRLEAAGDFAKHRASRYRYLARV